MPIVSIDWTKIKSLLDGSTNVYTLTNRQAALLSALANQLHWDKTFRIDGYDFADKDNLDAEISDLELYLNMPVSLSNIIELIDEVESLLRAIQQQSGCCNGVDPTNGDFYTDGVEDGVGSVPQDIIDAGYATDGNDWTGFDDYKCMISHLMIDHIEGILRALMPYIGNAGVIVGGISTVAALLGTIVTVAGGPVVIGILAAVAAAGALYAFLAELGDDATETLADKVQTNHQELACSFYNSDGIENSVINLKSKIDELFTPAEALILKNTNLDAVAKAMYGGRYDQQSIAQALADRGYNPDDFTCECIEYELYELRRVENPYYTGMYGGVTDNNHFNTQYWSPCHYIKSLAIWKTDIDEAVEFTLIALDITPSQCGGLYVWRLWDLNGNQLYYSNVKPTLPFDGVGYINLQTNQAYSNVYIETNFTPT